MKLLCSIFGHKSHKDNVRSVKTKRVAWSTRYDAHDKFIVEYSCSRCGTLYEKTYMFNYIQCYIINEEYKVYIAPKEAYE